MSDLHFSPDPLAKGTRFACRVEYLGHRYNGWQSQPGPNTETVQDKLQSALSSIAAAPVRIHCAGRTDTGVHALSQIVHFDAPAVRSPKAWVLGVNSELPPDIRVHWAQPVSSEFHARFSALSRRYRYLIADTLVRPALLHQLVTWHRRPLNAPRMHSAAQFLLGERDFSAFRAASCQSSSPMRNVTSASVYRRGEFVVLEICANAFLHHMVRNIAGTLIAVGDGRQAPEWPAALLQGRDRSKAADTASAAGLYLTDVLYPSIFALPSTPYGPALLGPAP